MRCDADFVPPLSARVDVRAYAQKMADNAMRFEAWDDDTLIGLVAVYCNDLHKRTAFITSVSVLPEWQGQGIGMRLMNACLSHVRPLGFTGIELEVDQRNQGAAALYQRVGFERSRASGTVLTMFLSLEA